MLDVCVDYVGRDGALDMDEIAGRFATQATLPLVFDSTEPPVVEAGLQHHGGKAILNSANLEDGEGEGKRMDRVFTLAREYGAAVICLTIDEEGQARDADWKLRVAQAHLRHRDAALRHRPDRPDLRPAHVPARRPATTTSAATRMETIEAIRRIKAELPGASTILGLVERVVRAEARGPARAQQRVPARVPRGRPRRRDRARGAHHADAQDRRPRSAKSRSISSTTGARDDYDPLTEFMALFEGVEAGAVEREDRSGWPVEERLKHRIIDGDRDGLEADLDEQLPVAARARRSSTTCCSTA